MTRLTYHKNYHENKIKNKQYLPIYGNFFYMKNKMNFKEENKVRYGGGRFFRSRECSWTYKNNKRTHSLSCGCTSALLHGKGVNLFMSTSAGNILTEYFWEVIKCHITLLLLLLCFPNKYDETGYTYTAIIIYSTNGILLSWQGFYHNDKMGRYEFAFEILNIIFLILQIFYFHYLLTFHYVC